MPLSFDDFTKALIAPLTEAERQGGVAYAAKRRLRAGTPIQLPGTRIEVPTEAYLGFIDREPGANWGHAARYVLVSRVNGEIRSLEVRLPPFGSRGTLRWHVVYHAPCVPETAVENP